MTDKELIEKVHNGNQKALSSMIELYYADIFHFCLYMVHKDEKIDKIIEKYGIPSKLGENMPNWRDGNF